MIEPLPPFRDVVLRVTAPASIAGVTASVARVGNPNFVITEDTITVGGKTVYVGDVIKQTGDTDVPAATYTVTLAGTAGTVTAVVTELNGDFAFTFNGTAVTATGSQSVTIASQNP